MLSATMSVTDSTTGITLLSYGPSNFCLRTRPDTTVNNSTNEEANSQGMALAPKYSPHLR